LDASHSVFQKLRGIAGMFATSPEGRTPLALAWAKGFMICRWICWLGRDHISIQGRVLIKTYIDGMLCLEAG
jgi:hypothetical protein